MSSLQSQQSQARERFSPENIALVNYKTSQVTEISFPLVAAAFTRFFGWFEDVALSLALSYAANAGEGIGRRSSAPTVPALHVWPVLKYWRSASRMNSDQVRCSAFRTCSSSSIISGGNETEKVAVVLFISNSSAPYAKRRTGVRSCQAGKQRHS